MGDEQGRIAFFSTYRPPVALDIYSCPTTPSLNVDGGNERQLTDGLSYNCNAQVIPKQSLKYIVQTITQKYPFITEFTEADIDSGRVSGFLFVSERTGDLETLHFALCLDNNPPESEHVFNFAELYDEGMAKTVRMEDSGCFGGQTNNYLVYVTTKDEAPHRRQPWTAVYKTCFITGKTDRLTPSLQVDLSPSVSPSGTKIAVASLQKRGGWYGEREKLKSDIFVMNIEKPYDRKLVIKDGGWPTWGSDHVIFFHRRIGSEVGNTWGVYRTDIRNGHTFRVTAEDINAVTPAAIDANLVAVATMRKTPKLKSFTDSHEDKKQYRQIEVFDSSGVHETVHITAHIKPLADHFNPFVIKGENGAEMRIGFNRCNKRGTLKSGEDDVPRQFDHVQSHHEDQIGLFRVSGVFPTFSSDGSKLAFVDNDFKSVWLVDEKPLRKMFQENNNIVFSPVWSQSKDVKGNDVLYACFGPAFNPKATVKICSITISKDDGKLTRKNLNKKFNNAFPSTSPDGTKLVYRSTRDHPKTGYKNLYILNDVTKDDEVVGNLTRLTFDECTDTHCKWSPNSDWIVFTSNRKHSDHEVRRKGDEDLDSGYFSVYLIHSIKSDVVLVMSSGNDLSGHVTHPFFSPNGKKIVVTSDFAAISADDPMSLPLYLHSARPYGDIFTVDIDDNPYEMAKKKGLGTLKRVTHTRYENATGTWTTPSANHPSDHWNQHIKTLPFFSSAPWLKTSEKLLVGSNMSTAAVAMMLVFPFATIAVLGFALFYIMKRYFKQRSSSQGKFCWIIFLLFYNQVQDYFYFLKVFFYYF